MEEGNDAISDALITTMYNRCFRALNRVDVKFSPNEQAKFINCYMRFIQSYQIIAEACSVGEYFADDDDDDDD